MRFQEGQNGKMINLAEKYGPYDENWIESQCPDKRWQQELELVS